jgi:hypothetical protein
MAGGMRAWNDEGVNSRLIVAVSGDQSRGDKILAWPAICLAVM